jgi:hypothetical protein
MIKITLALAAISLNLLACAQSLDTAEEVHETTYETKVDHSLSDQDILILPRNPYPRPDTIVLKLRLSPEPSSNEYIELTEWRVENFHPSMDGFIPFTCESNERLNEIKAELRALDICEIETIVSGPRPVCMYLPQFLDGFRLYNHDYERLGIYQPYPCTLSEGSNFYTYFCQEEQGKFDTLLFEIHKVTANCLELAN